MVRLKEFIRMNEMMTGGEAMALLKSVMSALKAMHSAGYIHTEIASDNIGICQVGGIKIMDYARIRKYKLNQQSPACAMYLGYCPIEQYGNGGGLGPWTDVYSLGATMYRMVTSRGPDEAGSRAVRDLLLPPNEYNPFLSKRFVNVLMKALAVNKKHRFKTVQEFERALEKALSEEKKK